jgi:hypothetical protein
LGDHRHVYLIVQNPAADRTADHLAHIPDPSWFVVTKAGHFA